MSRTPLTPDELAETEARANAATEGPWVADGSDDSGYFLCDGIRQAGDTGGQVAFPNDLQTPFMFNQEADVTFLLSARTDVPRLCESHRALMEALDAEREKSKGLAEALQWIHDYAVGCDDEMVTEKTEKALAAYLKAKNNAPSTG